MTSLYCTVVHESSRKKLIGINTLLIVTEGATAMEPTGGEGPGTLAPELPPGE